MFVGGGATSTPSSWLKRATPPCAARIASAAATAESVVSAKALAAMGLPCWAPHCKVPGKLGWLARGSVPAEQGPGGPA